MLLLTLAAASPGGRAGQYDVVVYGATASGAMAALAAAREGASVALVERGRFVGGLTSAGVGYTNEEDRALVGGYGLEFHRKAGEYYGRKIAWDLEPNVAAGYLKLMLKQAGVTLILEQPLREERGVKRKRRRIRKIISEDGEVFVGAVYIDSTYEGDLMAAAGVSYVSENEGSDAPAFSFAPCLTDAPRNSVAFPRPVGYDAERYRLILEHVAKSRASLGRELTIEDLLDVHRLPNEKAAVHTRSDLPVRDVGVGGDYCEASYNQRAGIWQAHLSFTAGLYYFLAHDERLPEAWRSGISQWGLCADEFIYSDNWPHQLNIRAGRRMVGEFVLSWKGIAGKAADGIGLARYRGTVFQIPYRVLLPSPAEVRNLLVTLSPSAGAGVAGALRNEPVTMVLGHAAGVAAAMAVQGGAAVQDVDVTQLRRKLREQKVVLEWNP